MVIPWINGFLYPIFSILVPELFFGKKMILEGGSETGCFAKTIRPQIDFYNRL